MRESETQAPFIRRKCFQCRRVSRLPKVPWTNQLAGPPFLHTNVTLPRPAGSTWSRLDNQSMREHYIALGKGAFSRSQRRRFFWSLALIKRIAAYEDENGKEAPFFLYKRPLKFIQTGPKLRHRFDLRCKNDSMPKDCVKI